MANRWKIPPEVEGRLRRNFKVCAYCQGRMKAYHNIPGCRKDKATIEHLNLNGPFHWPKGLKEEHLVIACGACNSSRGEKRLKDWFDSAYCQDKGINAKTVAPAVRAYLQTRAANKK